MYVLGDRSAIAARIVCAALGWCIAGCGAGAGLGGNPFDPGSLGEDVITYQDSAANDLLDVAQQIDVGSAPRVIQGQIDQVGDVDVYDIGPVAVGDHILVAVQTAETLPGAVAVFDDTGCTLLVNDHRNVYLGRKGPFVDLVIRRASDSCYIVMSGTPSYGGYGEYDLVVTRESNAPITDLHPDTILLVFNGGLGVRIGGRDQIDVPVFDAASISPTFEGRTKDLMARVVDLVREDYADFDVEIRSTSEGDVYDGHMSRLFFGTYDPALLGVAEGVDEYNSTYDQEAIVFTDTFAAFTPLDPSVEEMAQALANVASHEIGHLLGLVHTSDPAGIMDVTASLAELMVDQQFTLSPLNREVFPIGHENEVRSLLDAVGGNELARELADRLVATESPAPSVTARTLPPARAQRLFSSCALHGH